MTFMVWLLARILVILSALGSLAPYASKAQPRSDQDSANIHGSATKDVASTSIWSFPHISRDPPAANYHGVVNHGAPLARLPKFDPMNPWFSMDLRSADASRLDLRNSVADLEHVDFDSSTLWPPKERMPTAFDPVRVLELGKNPGLGIRALHGQGITGRGVGVGIVDQCLLTRHSEIAKRLKWYEEIKVTGDQPSEMHGPAVASIAVGQSVGVAPEADLYYIAVGDPEMSSMLSSYAQGIRRFLEINQHLPREHRIRAISISIGYGPNTPGYGDFMRGVKSAEAEGIFVAWCGDNARFSIYGLGVSPASNRDDFDAYTAPQLYRPSEGGSKCLFVPMDSRTTASPTGTNDYVFYGPGGSSWTVPYAAGAYALAAQLAPNITPEQFWSLAIKTGRAPLGKDRGRKVESGRILDFAALVKALTERGPTK
jgi:hypothetical protein